jgi:two-component system chemotaxis response regulator CheY
MSRTYKVMIADDSLFVQNRLVKLLTNFGYETIVAGDGEEAVSVYRQAKPDLVLMDITMPRKDGLEALTEIRRFDPRAKVIMLTALDQQSLATQALKAGARDFLVKPVPPPQLIATVQKVLR